MNNPLVTYTLDKLEIPNVIDVYKAIIEYKNGDVYMNCTLYDDKSAVEDFFSLEENLHPIDFSYTVDMNYGCYLIKQFSKVELTVGTDKSSIYDKDHRLVEYIRFVIPDGLLQIDYEDEQTALDAEDTMYEFMRSQLKEVK